MPQVRYLSATVQCKRSIGRKCCEIAIEYTFLHILPQHSHYFANLLTKHKARFYFSRKGTVWIDLRVIDCDIWYAEVLIPTYDYEAGAYSGTFKRQDVPMAFNLPLVLT